MEEDSCPELAPAPQSCRLSCDASKVLVPLVLVEYLAPILGVTVCPHQCLVSLPTGPFMTRRSLARVLIVVVILNDADAAFGVIFLAKTSPDILQLRLFFMVFHAAGSGGVAGSSNDYLRRCQDPAALEGHSR